MTAVALHKVNAAASIRDAKTGRFIAIAPPIDPIDDEVQDHATFERCD